MTNIQSAASLQKTVFGENLTREHTTGYLNCQSSDFQRGALHDSIFDDNPEYIRQWLQELEKELFSDADEASTINPAAEANVYGDPEAADIVFTCGAEIVVIGLNVTTQVLMTEQDLCKLRDSGGRYGRYIYNICQFYNDWHEKLDGLYGIYLHDPTCFAAVLKPHLVEFKKGAVHVETQDICTGHTLMDHAG